MRGSISYLALGGALLVAACGSSTEDRTVSGAGIGAAAGTVIGAVTGFGLIQGALVGAAAGGLTGAVTTQDQVNLGKPAWKNGSGGSAPAASQSAANPNDSLLHNIQSGLASLGYDPGPADGRIGPKTQAAIRKFQADNQLAVTGQPSAELWSTIKGRISS
jgi:peptidoglycan hydrolase-like protein with peptidoglycan-binding domain